MTKGGQHCRQKISKAQRQKIVTTESTENIKKSRRRIFDGIYWIYRMGRGKTSANR
jgi:hypothetical protein